MYDGSDWVGYENVRSVIEKVTISLRLDIVQILIYIKMYNKYILKNLIFLTHWLSLLPVVVCLVIGLGKDITAVALYGLNDLASQVQIPLKRQETLNIQSHSGT